MLEIVIDFNRSIIIIIIVAAYKISGAENHDDEAKHVGRQLYYLIFRISEFLHVQRR
ncbi:hypothetical protein M7I_0551 [Glarea lozoyensis 74030]|uniref:Uncharacterized protein n=1 Tax=Glarea lozoyensis (strain ATCC 74030 / MF5533) TaxID=1104152 RepID=H0EDU3_GLAL7|nr:hypothetical protein M7I_0551 [Glarea lozoyensis 74030]